MDLKVTVDTIPVGVVLGGNRVLADRIKKLLIKDGFLKVTNGDNKKDDGGSGSREALSLIRKVNVVVDWSDDKK